MSKTLEFSYEGRDYVLEFTRRSVEMMERQGFRSEDLRDKPMTALPALFAGAFIANHRFAKPDTITEIYSHLTNKQELLSKLIEMYNEPIAALMDEPEDGDAGKVQWTASW